MNWKLHWCLLFVKPKILCSLVIIINYQFGFSDWTYMENPTKVLENGDPDSKIHGANVGPTWGRQNPGGPHVSHTDLAIWWQFHRNIHNFQKKELDTISHIILPEKLYIYGPRRQTIWCFLSFKQMSIGGLQYSETCL